MSNTQAANHIKDLLNQGNGQREDRVEAEQFAMGLGLTFFTALTFVREIEAEMPWYGDLDERR